MVIRDNEIVQLRAKVAELEKSLASVVAIQSQVNEIVTTEFAIVDTTETIESIDTGLVETLRRRLQCTIPREQAIANEGKLREDNDRFLEANNSLITANDELFKAINNLTAANSSLLKHHDDSNEIWLLLSRLVLRYLLPSPRVLRLLLLCLEALVTLLLPCLLVLSLQAALLM